MEAKDRVLGSENKLVKQILKDFRLFSSDEPVVAKLEGESKTRDWSEREEKEGQVFVHFFSKRDWLLQRASFFHRWIRAFRLYYLSFSLFPQALALIYLWKQGPEPSIILVVSFTTLLHLACILWSDYEDHLRGVDVGESSGGSGVIRNLWIPAIHIRNAAILFLGMSLVIGVFLASTLQWDGNGRILLALGLLGTVGAVGFSGWPLHYKYMALGEVFIFFLSGPMIVVGTALFFHTEWDALAPLIIASIPLGLLAILHLHCGNIRRIPYDIQAKVRSMASIMGFTASKYLFYTLLALIYLSPILLYVSQSLGIWVLLTYLSLPVALYQLRLMHKATGPLDPLTSQLYRSCPYLTLSFSLLYLLAGFLSKGAWYI